MSDETNDKKDATYSVKIIDMYSLQYSDKFIKVTFYKLKNKFGC
jgi:hypothetical protein